MKHKNKNPYALRAGVALKRTFYGRVHTLIVRRDGGEFQFGLDGRIFDSLTAAAKHVCRDETRSISGPQFWGLPPVKRSPKPKP